MPEDLHWYIPFLIFAARIGDVSIGTVRMIFVINGWRYRAAAVGFVEVLIWAGAVGGLVSHLTNPLVLLAYAGGYSTGTLVGITIEQRLGFGIRLVRVVNSERDLNVSVLLRERGYRVTRVEGTGRDGAVELAFAVVRRKSLPEILAILEEVAPKAIVTVERADSVSQAALIGDTRLPRRTWSLFSGQRK